MLQCGTAHGMTVIQASSVMAAMRALTVLMLLMAVLGKQGRAHGMRRAWCIRVADEVVGKPWGACRVGHAGAFVARHAAGAL